MLAYKITAPGLVATMGSNRNFQLKMGLNETPVANCRKNGYHCAENPLDCLNYYHSLIGNEIYIVDAGGDIDEDASDSKISCTELTIIRQITVPEFIAAALLYVRKYPERPTHSLIKDMAATAEGGYCIAKGRNPRCKAKSIGDVLGFLKINGNQIEIKVLVADGEKIKTDVWYDSDGKEVFKYAK